MKYIWIHIQDSRKSSIMAKSHADISSTIEYGVGVHGSQCSSTRSYLAEQTIGGDGISFQEPTILYEDNKAAILFSNHPGDHRRSKHIDTRKYFLRDAVINGEIKLEYN